MGAIADRSIVDLESACKFAGLITNDCDAIWLEILLGGVKDLADGLCQNKFVKENEFEVPILDDDGNEQELNIPNGVEMWVLRKFARVARYRISGSNEVVDVEDSSIKPDRRDWTELGPFIKYNGPRKSQTSESNLSYRVEWPDGDYYYIV